MTAPSPNLVESAMVSFTIKSNGKAIDSTIGIETIETFSKVNKVPHARLTIFDGNAATQDFPASDSATFVPGAKIDIALGYAGGTETSVFAGVVVRQGIEIHPDGAPRLIVDIYDQAMAMTLARKNAIFQKTKDSDLIGKLISQNGLSKSVEATSAVHPEVVQYYASDWDMMILRAEANGMVAIVDKAKVTVAKPDSSSKPVLNAAFGDSILDFRAELDAASQFAAKSIASSAWDAGQQKIVSKKANAARATEAGDVSSATLAKVFGIDPFAQQSGAELAQPSLQSWSDAEHLRSALSKIRGSVSFQGSAKVKTGNTIELSGVGDKFNGVVLASAVRHDVQDGRWTTSVEFGLPEKSYAATTPDIPAPGASGLIPPISGLQTGIVKKVAKDPDGEYRVEIELPLLQAGGKTVWARLATFYASNKVGAVFYPELGDEVVVAFMNDDPRYPVILGSAFSKKNPPPVAPDEKNEKKVLVTRSKLTVSFDDKDKVIEIRTPGNNVITLDDKSSSIKITDKNKNSIKLEKGGITLDSAAKLTVKAKGDISIAAGAGLKMSAKAAASLEGAQVTHKAKAKFSAQGNAASELKSSGITTVKGSLVKIN